MNQLYEKKCECRQYDESCNQSSTLIKMEDPEYEDNQYSGTSHIIFRAVRFIGYLVVLVLLGYLLWRMRVIESTILTNNRFTNFTQILEGSNLYRHRIARSIKASNQLEHNSFGPGEKEPSRGSTLSSKNEESARLSQTRTGAKENFEQLVDSLFNKIWFMHNDTDRSHFDNNMKAVFQAWFPVFDALLPHELMEYDATENTKSAETNLKEERGKREVDKTEKRKFLRKHKNLIQSVQKNKKKSLRQDKLRKHSSSRKINQDSSDLLADWNKRMRMYSGNENKEFSKEASKMTKKNDDSSKSSESLEYPTPNNNNKVDVHQMMMLTNHDDFMNKVSLINK